MRSSLSQMKAVRPSKRESRIYLSIASAVLFTSLMAVSYLDGHAAEEARRQHDVAEAAAAEHQVADYWHGKYESLADESDGVTIIAAEMKLQQEGGR